MTSFGSILFPYHDAAVDALTAPDCFADLHLDQVIEAATIENPDDDLKSLFYAPLHDVPTVAYRHDVFRDLHHDEIRRPVDNFVAAMRTMRDRLHQAARLYHPLQRHGWFVHAVTTYCGALATLRDELTATALASPGLRGFADHVCHYVDSERFQTLQADAYAVQDELHSVRYAVHIDGLRVHVGKYTKQPDYSADVATIFERFATEAIDDYHVRLKSFVDMDHIEEQVLECVAKLHPQSFARLEDCCTRNAHFVEPVIARFEQEIHFYLSYLAFVDRFSAVGLTFSYPDVTTEPGVVSVENCFDIALAVKSIDENKPLVCNSFHLSGPERTFVVTGPNQGGKTTFARSIGQCAYLLRPEKVGACRGA